jgi:hypothetical protein
VCTRGSNQALLRGPSTSPLDGEDMRTTLPDTPRRRDSLLRVILVGPPRGLWHFAAERSKE